MAWLWDIVELHKAVVPPSLDLGSDIHQKSIIHCSVVGVTIVYLTLPLNASCAVVEPPVADYFTPLR